MNERAVALAVALFLFATAFAPVAAAAPHYHMSLDVDWDAGTYLGELDVGYTNETDIQQTEVFFRLYGNAPSLYGSAVIEVTAAAVDDEPVVTALFADDTVLLVPLPSPAGPGESKAIHLSFRGAAAQVGVSGFASDTEYGLLTRSSETLTLTAFYPLLAPYTSEGWVIDPVASIGDALFAGSASYDVTLVVASELTVIPTPDTTERDPDGRTRCSFARDGLRDFSLIVVAGARTPEVATGSGVSVRSWFSPHHSAAAAIALERAMAAVDVYSALFGPLPYAGVDVVEVPLQRVAGVECSGLFLVASDYAADPQNPFFDVIISHEMAHQWFYAAVGNDPAEEPWLDEALATFASNVFLAAAVSESTAETERARWAATYDRATRDAPRLRVTSPVYAFPDSNTYSAFVYSGGAHELDALRREIGTETFFLALADYYNGHVGSIAAGADLLASFRGACDCWPVSPLFDAALAPSP